MSEEVDVSGGASGRVVSSLSLSEDSEGESEVGDEPVAVAQPPQATSRADQEASALTGSAALDILDQLLATNQIGKERAARLCRKYNHLRETLESSRVLENSLLTEVKGLGKQLAQQQRVLERAGAFPEGDNSESSRLRQVLLQHRNDLDQAQERIDKLQHEITHLEEEHGEVEREWGRLPKKEELEQHIRELQRQCEELQDETTLRTQDAQRYHEELDRKNYRLSNIMQEAEELKQLEERLQDELVEIRTAPGNLPREIDAVRKQRKEAEARIAEEKAFLEELRTQLSELQGTVTGLFVERAEVGGELERKRTRQQAREVDLERLGKDLATAKDRETTLLEDRATLELHLRHRGSEYRSLFESLSLRNKEKDKELKQLKKAELQLGAVRLSLEQQQRQKELLSQHLAGVGERLEGGRRRREEVGVEVEQMARTLTHQEGVSEDHRLAVEGRGREEGQLRERVRRKQALLHDLTRDVVSMTKARDQDAREFYKTRRQQWSVGDDLKTKEGQIEEQRKRLRQLETQLKDFADAYEVVKAERNKTHAQIQIITQLSAELREKSKILQNEIDILRTSAKNKERILQKCSLVESMKVLERDTQRQEMSKVRMAQGELNSSLESQREGLHNLTQQVNSTEQHLNRLRHYYEQAVQERNDLGLQLIERNEEVCVFYEKINVHDSVIRKANMELLAREEEIRFVRMELSRLQNDLLVGRKALPEKMKLETELAASQVELKECEECLRALEQAVECATDPGRLRLLSGSDPSRSELREKIESLEAQLAEREQQLLEKELLQEQVCRLTDRAQKRADSQKESTLQVAKHVNHYRARIKETTRKTMALVSELSMQQAMALRLQQEVQEGESRVEQAYVRLEAGEAPEDAATLLWEKEQQREEQRAREREAKRKLAEEEEAQLLHAGVYTTAEPRPNAYMPTGEGELPIPKPYGSHAPFKPTQPGANIRHIRKPEPKPINI